MDRYFVCFNCVGRDVINGKLKNRTAPARAEVDRSRALALLNAAPQKLLKRKIHLKSLEVHIHQSDSNVNVPACLNCVRSVFGA